MKQSHGQRDLIVVLVAASLTIYVIHFAIFRDAYNLWFYGIMDVAFTPISVLLVTLVINRLLTEREKQSLLNKLDMVIGVFFTDVGTRLLSEFSCFDAQREEYRDGLSIGGGWDSQRFAETGRKLGSFPFRMDVALGNLAGLKAFLHEKRGFLLRLLENPNLLAHETFTELLLAVTHVAEELDYRPSLENLPAGDRAHLAGDIKRAYGLLIREWLTYLAHLKSNYPYLYSLAVRTNPFDATAEVVIRE